MATVPCGTYVAVPARPASVSTDAFIMPAHVQRKFINADGLRCTQVLAVCNSAGIDNDALVDAIAGLLNAADKT